MSSGLATYWLDDLVQVRTLDQLTESINRYNWSQLGTDFNVCTLDYDPGNHSGDPCYAAGQRIFETLFGSIMCFYLWLVSIDLLTVWLILTCWLVGSSWLILTCICWLKTVNRLLLYKFDLVLKARSNDLSLNPLTWHPNWPNDCLLILILIQRWTQRTDLTKLKNLVWIQQNNNQVDQLIQRTKSIKQRLQDYNGQSDSFGP